MSAIGGENVTTTVEGRARFPVSVRYPRDLRSDLETLGRVLVMTPSGAQVPLAQVADIRTVTGPSMIRNENGLLVGYVYVDITGRDVGGYVDDAKRAVGAAVKLPSGYALEWSGQYENMQRVTQRLKLVVPFTLFLILFLLYANTKSLAKTLIVVLAVPFSVIGAVWLLWALDYNVSIAVWVGMIALMGLDAETGVFMLLFLDLAYDEAKAKGRLRSMADLHEAIVHGAVKRLRPKMMTVDRRHGRPDADHVVDRHRLGRDEAGGSAHGGRARHVVPARAARLSGRLPALALAHRGAPDRGSRPGAVRARTPDSCRGCRFFAPDDRRHRLALQDRLEARRRTTAPRPPRRRHRVLPHRAAPQPRLHRRPPRRCRGTAPRG